MFKFHRKLLQDLMNFSLYTLGAVVTLQVLWGCGLGYAIN